MSAPNLKQLAEHAMPMPWEPRAPLSCASDFRAAVTPEVFLEMLEALDMLTAYLENSIELLGHDPADDARVKRARAAIAKATGSAS